MLLAFFKKGDNMNANGFTVSILSVSKAGKTSSSDIYMIRCHDNKEINSDKKNSCKLDGSGTLVINGVDSVVSGNRSLNNIRGSVKRIVIEKGVKGIGPEAFRDFDNLKEIIIPSTVSYIDRGAFMNCESLSKISFSYGLKSIGDNAFMSCSSLKSVNIPSGLVRIGSGCFENCTNLRNITLPDSIRIIDSNAFKNCRSLLLNDLPACLIEISKNAFCGCELLNDKFISNEIKKDNDNNQVCNIDSNVDELSSDFIGNEEKISIFELSSLDYYILKSLESGKNYSRNKIKKAQKIGMKYESFFSKSFLTPAELNNRI